MSKHSDSNPFPVKMAAYKDELNENLQDQLENVTLSSDGDIKERIVEALKNVYDPEIPVNIYDLGLIYNIEVNDESVVFIAMTLTTPGCPVAETFPIMVEQMVCKVEGVNDCEVEIVWDPPWTKDMLTEEAMVELGLI